MADNKKTEGQAQPSSGGSPLLIVILVLLLALLILAGGATWLLLSKGKAEQENAAPAVQEYEIPVFMKLDTFTSNLLAENGTPGDSYLQLAIELRVDSKPLVKEKVATYSPVIRDVVLLILANKKPSDLHSVRGKEALAEEIRLAINRKVGPMLSVINPQEGPVEEVLYTTFIVQ